MDIFEYKANLILASIVSILSIVFGDFWFLFIFLLVLNIFDYITGTMKARYLKEESSEKAFIGFAKTVFTWILIIVSFGIGMCFVEVGEKLNFNLGFMGCLGWFMLTHCIINEVRSILENIVEMDKGELIPSWLIRGLEVAQNIVDKKVNDAIDKFEGEKEEEENVKNK